MILGGMIHGSFLGVRQSVRFLFVRPVAVASPPLHNFCRTFRWAPHNGVAPMRKPWPFVAQRRDPLQIASPDHLRGSTRRAIQRQFLHALGHYLHVVWPVLFGILSWQLGLGILIAWIERWSLGDGVYFTFVTGLTIGYGDLVPHQPLSRFLAIFVGLLGTVLTGLIAAIAVRALQTATDDST
jgi:Ion channel